MSSLGESLRGAGGVVAQLGSAVPFLWGGVAMSSGVFGVASIVAGLRSRRWSWALQGLVGIGAPCLMVAMAAAVLVMRANRGG